MKNFTTGKSFALIVVVMVGLSACSQKPLTQKCDWNDPINLSMECIKGLGSESCSLDKMAEMFPESKESLPVLEEIESVLQADGSYTVKGPIDIKDESGTVTKNEWQCTTPEYDDRQVDCPTTCTLL